MQNGEILEYRLEPRQVAEGTRWVTLHLANVADERLDALDVQLQSLDTGSISVYGAGVFLSRLDPGEELEVSRQVEARSGGEVYISVSGQRGGEPFVWESLPIQLNVGPKLADIVGVFTVTPPYPVADQVATVEAIVRARAEVKGLVLELCARSPSERSVDLAVFRIGKMRAGDEGRYSTEVTLDEEGSYFVYAYLRHDDTRLDRKTDQIYVTAE